MSDSYTKNDIEELWRKSYDTEESSKEKYFLNVYCGCFRKNDGNEIANKFQPINNDIKLEVFPKLVTFQGTFGYILNMYTDFNIFGRIVLFPYIIGGVGVISIVIMLMLYKSFGRKQKIA